MPEIRQYLVGSQVSPEYAATYAHASGTSEDTAFDFATRFPSITGKRVKNIAIFFDTTNLTQSTTFRLKVAVDGTNLRTIETLSWTTADDDGVWLHLASCAQNIRLTAQSAVAEGASRNIPILVTFEQVEQ